MYLCMTVLQHIQWLVKREAASCRGTAGMVDGKSSHQAILRAGQSKKLVGVRIALTAQQPHNWVLRAKTCVGKCQCGCQQLPGIVQLGQGALTACKEAGNILGNHLQQSRWAATLKLPTACTKKKSLRCCSTCMMPQVWSAMLSAIRQSDFPA